MKNVAAIIEARMTSSRLPGKVLLPAGGKPLLGHLISRIKEVSSIQEIVLATTVNVADQALVEFAKTSGIRCFRGSEDDVLSRVLGAADSVSAGVIAEITGDCPLIDPMITDQLVKCYLANNIDYAANVHVQSFPVGMDTQVYSTELLRKVSTLTNDPLDREHVTRYIRQRPEVFSHFHLMAPSELEWPELWVVLDERADYEFISAIVEHFGEKKFGCREIIHLLKNERPELLEKPLKVKRKGVNE